MQNQPTKKGEEESKKCSFYFFYNSFCRTAAANDGGKMYIEVKVVICHISKGSKFFSTFGPKKALCAILLNLVGIWLSTFQWYVRPCLNCAKPKLCEPSISLHLEHFILVGFLFWFFFFFSIHVLKSCSWSLLLMRNTWLFGMRPGFPS